MVFKKMEWKKNWSGCVKYCNTMRNSLLDRDNKKHQQIKFKLF